MSIHDQLLVFSDNFLAPFLIVLFSYLIWVQSYQSDIFDLEQTIRERYENQAFPWEGEDIVYTAHAQCTELEDLSYRFQRIFYPFRDLEGHTIIQFFILDDDYRKSPEEIEANADFEEGIGVTCHEGEYTILMHEVEPEGVSGAMEQLFVTIY